MLKAAAKTNKGHMVVLGLSWQNLKKLKAGQPIIIDLEELGIKGSSAIIFSGKTEEAMGEMIQESIGPETTVHPLPARWP